MPARPVCQTLVCQTLVRPALVRPAFTAALLAGTSLLGGCYYTPYPVYASGYGAAYVPPPVYAPPVYGPPVVGPVIVAPRPYYRYRYWR